MKRGGAVSETTPDFGKDDCECRYVRWTSETRSSHSCAVDLFSREERRKQRHELVHMRAQRTVACNTRPDGLRAEQRGDVDGGEIRVAGRFEREVGDQADPQ